MKTEQRLILALGLSFLIIAVYPYALKKFFPQWANLPPVEQNTPPHESVEKMGQPRESAMLPPALSGAREPELRAPRYTTDTKRIQTSRYELKFSPQGALVQYLDLLAFEKSGEEQSSILVNATDGPGAFQLWLKGFESASSSGVYQQKEIFASPRDNIVFEAVLDSKIKIEKRFDFSASKNAFRFVVTLTNLTEDAIAAYYELSSQLYFTETGYDHSFVELNLDTPEKIHSKKADKLKKEPFIYDGKFEWLAMSRKYFSIIIAPDSTIAMDEVRARQLAPDTLESVLRTRPFEILSRGQVVHEYLVYAGPNQYSDLKLYDLGFQKILSKGWFGSLKVGMLILMNWCYQWLPNYGVAIILLTVIIKILFTPLTHISFESMRRMQALQPKIKALQASFKKDPQKAQMEVMKLYKKNKVNPLMGCLPMALQMPIFIALYQVLSQAVELRGAPFVGWIHDLSAPDRLFTLPFSIPFLGNGINVLPLIMIGSMIWQQKLTPSTSADPNQEKIMMFMPIIFGVLFYNLPSGLVLYWTLSNFLTIFHQLVIKRIPFHLHPDTE
ncbi:MAG: membrane protein insertase YidC [Candidatus Omnitrophica bacterium]|nr:membrane protein insertase YidC [Candidatus Omnitrophota bacterium]